MKLFQIFNNLFNDEQFCFHATDQSDAEIKRCNWLSHHGFNDAETSREFELREVEKPKYENNVHNEWVS